jgi:serine/threonine protein kinase
MSPATAEAPTVASPGLRINARCDEFERTWKSAATPPSIEQFADGSGGTERARLLTELINLDVQYRIATTGDAELPDYAAQFPELVNDIPRTVGQYILLEHIGSGGMGTVYRAVHRRMKREVAVKVLRSDVRDNARLRELFDQEIRAAARLSHPNIVTAYDAGQSGDLAYLVSEFIDGDNLAALVNAAGPLAPEFALDCIRQVAQGLQYAHEQGIIHRDVKPANLLLDPDGVVRVTDLGLAGLHHSTHPDQTQVQLGTVGTPAYMAPEQAAHADRADARADIYSLGRTLRFLLTGSPDATPLTGDLARLNPLLQKMLAPRPEDRHQSMREVAREIERLLAHRGNRPARKLLAMISIPLLACLLAAVPWSDATTTPAAPAKTPALITHPTGMHFRLMPPGQCWIGSSESDIQRMLAAESNPDMRQRLASETRRLATIAKPIFLGDTEVTIGQFRRFVQATGYITEAERDRHAAYGLRDGHWVHDVGYSWQHLGEQPMTDDHPVCNLTHTDAVAFCDWLTNTSPNGQRFRLPTESEWEYACRAGASSTWPFADTPALLPVYAWCRANSAESGKPVATRSPNALGLFDMLGNVEELCIDDSSPAVGWTPALVLKGGNISGGSLHLRPAARNPTHSHAAEGGFRVLMEPAAFDKATR